MSQHSGSLSLASLFLTGVALFTMTALAQVSTAFRTAIFFEPEVRMTPVSCGDGILDNPPETCDWRGNVGCTAPLSCNQACSACQNLCNNGTFDTPAEACDASDTVVTNGGCTDPLTICNGTCTQCLLRCGNGIKDTNPSEACDTLGNVGCGFMEQCQPGCGSCLNTCGNLQLDPSPEVCDESAMPPLNGCADPTTQFCDPTCTTCSNYCGNGIKDTTPLEACDITGNIGCAVGQTCAPGCGACTDTCGDGFKTGIEACDTLGNISCVAGSTCNSTCSQCVLDCGNGTIEPGEQCDTFGTGVFTPNNQCTSYPNVPAWTSGTVTCDANCTLNTSACVAQVCNDSIWTQPGEVCDGTATPSGCTGMNLCNGTCTACTNSCGNGQVNVPLGEACDGTASPTGCAGMNVCNAGCTSCVTSCGNGQYNAALGEVCDGTATPTNCTGMSLCNATCLACVNSCGNTVVDIPLGEACDATAPSNGGCTGGWACNATCSNCVKDCGNTVVDLAKGEVCDGTATPTGCTGMNLCNATCLACVNSCGNTVVDIPLGEACDATAPSNGGCAPINQCNAGCTACSTTCGNNVVNLSQGEACDPSASSNGGCAAGATCNVGCTLCVANCGNATLDAGEACDMGTAQNTGACGRCSATCAARCGDGVTTGPSETCDDGCLNGQPGKCNATCNGVVSQCGNAIIEPPEQCEGTNVQGTTCQTQRSLYMIGGLTPGGTGLHSVNASPLSSSLTRNGTYVSSNIYAVDVQGSYAYAIGFVGSNDDLISIFDIRGNTPILVSTSPVIQNSGISDFHVEGSYLYAATTSGLKMVDVSNPLALSLAGEVILTNTSSVDVQGSYAYVSNGTTLRIYDVSNPASIVAKGTLFWATGFNEIDVSGSYVYVIGGTGLRTVDVSNVNSPTFSGGTVTMSLPWEVKVSGTYVYVADRGYGLRIVTTGGSPTLVRSYGIGTQPENLQVSGSMVYLLDFQNLYIIDATNPAAQVPVTKQTFAVSTSGGTNGRFDLGTYAGSLTCSALACTIGTASCQFCGNGSVDTGEICDDGVQNGQPNKCNASCTAMMVAVCGNSVIEPKGPDGILGNADDEECDPPIAVPAYQTCMDGAVPGLQYSSCTTSCKGTTSPCHGYGLKVWSGQVDVAYLNGQQMLRKPISTWQCFEDPDIHETYASPAYPPGGNFCLVTGFAGTGELQEAAGTKTISARDVASDGTYLYVAGTGDNSSTCGQYQTQAACNLLLGCNWSTGYCDGSSSCRSYSSQTNCENDKYCTWQTSYCFSPDVTWRMQKIDKDTSSVVANVLSTGNNSGRGIPRGVAVDGARMFVVGSDANVTSGASYSARIEQHLTSDLSFCTVASCPSYTENVMSLGGAVYAGWNDVALDPTYVYYVGSKEVSLGNLEWHIVKQSRTLTSNKPCDLTSATDSYRAEKIILDPTGSSMYIFGTNDASDSWRLEKRLNSGSCGLDTSFGGGDGIVKSTDSAGTGDDFLGKSAALQGNNIITFGDWSVSATDRQWRSIMINKTTGNPDLTYGGSGTGILDHDATTYNAYDVVALPNQAGQPGSTGTKYVFVGTRNIASTYYPNQAWSMEQRNNDCGSNGCLGWQWTSSGLHSRNAYAVTGDTNYVYVVGDGNDNSSQVPPLGWRIEKHLVSTGQLVSGLYTKAPDESPSAASDIRTVAGVERASSGAVNTLAMKVWANQSTDLRGLQAVYTSQYFGGKMFYTKPGPAGGWKCSTSYDSQWKDDSCINCSSWSYVSAFSPTGICNMSTYGNPVGFADSNWIWDTSSSCSATYPVVYCRYQWVNP